MKISEKLTLWFHSSNVAGEDLGPVFLLKTVNKIEKKCTCKKKKKCTCNLAIKQKI